MDCLIPALPVTIETTPICVYFHCYFKLKTVETIYLVLTTAVLYVQFFMYVHECLLN